MARAASDIQGSRFPPRGVILIAIQILLKCSNEGVRCRNLRKEILLYSNIHLFIMSRARNSSNDLSNSQSSSDDNMYAKTLCVSTLSMIYLLLQAGDDGCRTVHRQAHFFFCLHSSIYRCDGYTAQTERKNKDLRNRFLDSLRKGIKEKVSPHPLVYHNINIALAQRSGHGLPQRN